MIIKPVYACQNTFKNKDGEKVTYYKVLVVKEEGEHCVYSLEKCTCDVYNNISQCLCNPVNVFYDRYGRICKFDNVL